MLTDALLQEDKSVGIVTPTTHTQPQTEGKPNESHPRGWAHRCLRNWLDETRRGAGDADREAALEGQKQIDPLTRMT